MNPHERPTIPFQIHPECCWPYRPEKVQEYAELLREGHAPPPVILTEDGRLLDGVHRVEAWMIVHGSCGALPRETLPLGEDPAAFVQRIHAGVRQPSYEEQAQQIRRRMAVTGKSLEQCLAVLPDESARRKILMRVRAAERAEKAPPKPPAAPVSRASSSVLLAVPDSHGAHIDVAARDVLIRDARLLRPKTVVLLGDHLDCGGFLSTHQRSYTKELTESYADDCRAANEFLDLLQKACPGAEFHYLEGNHEFHVERWASRAVEGSAPDAADLLDKFGPEAVLKLKDRGIRYYRQGVQHMGILSPGTIRLGKCHFVHGISASKHATATHADRFAGNVVHGHTHRSQAHIKRTVANGVVGAWCPGTLAKLQMLYNHNNLTDWSHGYGVQFVEKSGRFMHVNIPIFDGTSLLPALLGRR